METTRSVPPACTQISALALQSWSSNLKSIRIPPTSKGCCISVVKWGKPRLSRKLAMTAVKTLSILRKPSNVLTVRFPRHVRISVSASCLPAALTTPASSRRFFRSARTLSRAYIVKCGVGRPQASVACRHVQHKRISHNLRTTIRLGRPVLHVCEIWLVCKIWSDLVGLQGLQGVQDLQDLLVIFVKLCKICYTSRRLALFMPPYSA